MHLNFQSYEELKKHYDELLIVQHYLPGVTIGKPFNSPIRTDKNASAIIYIGKRGDLMYNDFVYNGDIPQLVAWLYNESYSKALRRIIKDFSGGFNTSPRKYINNTRKYFKKGSIPTQITPYLREWRKYDEVYWTVDGGIPLSWLESPEVNVLPFIKARINSKNGEHFIKADKLAYCYQYHTYNGIVRYKLYQPMSKKLKWLSNIVSGNNGGVVQLWETLPKHYVPNSTLIITSSLKDGAVIRCNLSKYDPNIYAIAPNNEYNFLPDYVVEKIKARFDRIIVWMDSDDGGIKGMKKFNTKYGWDYVYIPFKFKAKDQYSFRKKYGEKEFIELSKYLVYGKIKKNSC